MDWYALFVETGKEKVVQDYLRMSFEESVLFSIVPQRKVPEKRQGTVHHVIKKMFPGYVLFKTDMNNDTFHKIQKIPNSHYLVNHGTYYSKSKGACFSKIHEDEMALILRLIGEEEIIDYSKVVVENSSVFVTSGPLKGMEGRIQKVDKRKRRAKIRLDFMGVEKCVDVGIEVISKPL